MRAVTLGARPGEIRVEDKPKPGIIEPGDALVKVSTAAICGSDLHFLGGRYPTEPGMIIGHEFVGVVEEVGDAVHSVNVGDRYVAAMYPACGTCRACMRHQYRSCSEFKIFGGGPAFGDLDGAQAEYVRVPLADMALCEVPPGLTDEDVIFTGDIMATAWSALTHSRVRPGDTVAVVGAGPLGQLVVMAAPLFGVERIFAVDVDPKRLKEAEALGAVAVDAGELDPSDFVFDHTNYQGVDVVVEAAGNAKALETAWSLVRTAGTVAMIGMLTDEDWPISCGDNWLRAITVVPVVGDPLTHRHDLMRLIGAGRLDPGSIVTHTMPLDEGVEAYRMFQAREATKIVLKP